MTIEFANANDLSKPIASDCGWDDLPSMDLVVEDDKELLPDWVDDEDRPFTPLMDKNNNLQNQDHSMMMHMDQPQPPSQVSSSSNWGGLQYSPTGPSDEVMMMGADSSMNRLNMMTEEDVEEAKLIYGSMISWQPSSPTSTHNHGYFADQQQHQDQHSLPYEKRFKATLRNLQLSMKRSQMTRSSLAIQPRTTSVSSSSNNSTSINSSNNHYDRHSTVDAVRLAVQESALQLERAMQVVAAHCDGSGW